MDFESIIKAAHLSAETGTRLQIGQMHPCDNCTEADGIAEIDGVSSKVANTVFKERNIFFQWGSDQKAFEVL